MVMCRFCTPSVERSLSFAADGLKSMISSLIYQYYLKQYHAYCKASFFVISFNVLSVAADRLKAMISSLIYQYYLKQYHYHAKVLKAIHSSLKRRTIWYVIRYHKQRDVLSLSQLSLSQLQNTIILYTINTGSCNETYNVPYPMTREEKVPRLKRRRRRRRTTTTEQQKQYSYPKRRRIIR